MRDNPRKMSDRSRIGDVITDWIAAHPKFQIRDIVVTQSSDSDYHCLAFSIFYFQPNARR